jgi:MFS family permease
VTTFREIFSHREFQAIFYGNAASVAGKTMQMLALSALVYASTGSPLLAALAYLGGLLPQAIGALTLLSFADRVRPRGFLAAWDAGRAVAALILAAGVLPVWAMLLLVAAFGAVDALTGAVRGALLVDVLPDGFVLGRSVLNISVAAMQIVGFAAGGTLVATFGTPGALFAAAALISLSAVVTVAGLRSRKPRAAGRAGVTATWRGNRALLGSRDVRPLLMAAWLPNGLVVGAEAMYVPYAGAAAGVLFVAAAAGMLTGDLVIGRWVPPRARERLVNPLHTLLAAPYLLFVVTPAVWLGAVAVFVASVGFAGTLGVQQRLVAVVPGALRGQALGLDGSGRMTFQAVGASLVGAVAEATGAPLAMTVAALASLLVTALLWPALRVSAARPASRPGGAGEIVPPVQLDQRGG